MQKYKDENLISHLEALRETLLRCLIALGLLFLPAFFIAPYALKYLIKILIGSNNITLNYFSPIEVFILEIKLALIIDLIFSFPYIAKKLWDFILPALYENERKFIKTIVVFSSLLFVFGVLFCIFIILPFIINFGLSFSNGDIKAIFGISNVINLSLQLSLVFGFMFQIPLVVHFLIKCGIVDYKTIADKRPYVIVGILILSAILTPPDIISQIMLFVPVYALFEFGLLFSGRFLRTDRQFDYINKDITLQGKGNGGK